jgi:hypothetical protein
MLEPTFGKHRLSSLTVDDLQRVDKMSQSSRKWILCIIHIIRRRDVHDYNIITYAFRHLLLVHYFLSVRHVVGFVQTPKENITAAHALRKHLFKNYDRVVVPATSKKLVQIKMITIFNSVELVNLAIVLVT